MVEDELPGYSVIFSMKMTKTTISVFRSKTVLARLFPAASPPSIALKSRKWSDSDLRLDSIRLRREYAVALMNSLRVVEIVNIEALSGDSKEQFKHSDQ